jgi:hypothetical protein
MGVKTPAGVTPVPDQVPPAGVNPVSVYPPEPEHKLTSLPALTTGKGVTVTVTLLILVHPLESVTVTVYVVVLVGLAVTVAPEVVFKPNAGDHA